MTIRHLEVFLAVVDNGYSITRASESLHIAQPAVSQSILSLEEYYGVKLFERLNRRLYITKDGEKLLSYARHLVGSFDVMEEMMLNKEVVPLRIATSITVGTCYMPEIIKLFKRPIEMNVFNTWEIEKGLLENTIDVGVVEGKIINESEFVQKVVHKDELVVVCKKGYDCIKPIWIMREKGSGTRKTAMEGFGITENDNVWNISNTQTIKRMVEEGLGVTIISKKLVEEELKKGIMVLYSSEKIKRTYRYVYHKDKFIDSRIKEFINIMLSYKVKS